MNKLVIEQDGKIYTIRDSQGRYWMGPRLLSWEAPREPGASVPCWMTGSKEAAECQAALLQTTPTREHVFLEQLDKAIEFHRTNANDSHNVGNAVIACLVEIRNAWVKAINEGSAQ